jgi:aspartate/tyrosine/aromatic aminotransferase
VIKTDLSKSKIDEVVSIQQLWPQLLKDHDNPINTTIGVMIDENGVVIRPQTIKTSIAETIDNIQASGSLGYPTFRGNTDFLKYSAEWIFGEHDVSWPQSQAIGGTGSLYLASKLLSRVVEAKHILIDSGWDNHKALFSDFIQHEYNRICDGAVGYDHEIYMQELAKLPKDSIVLIQAFGYNGDGFDRSPQELEEVLGVCLKNGHCIVLDAAYLGLASGFSADKEKIQQIIDKGCPTFICLSFSKNMGLYQERLGALFIRNIDSSYADTWQAQIEKISRATYSFVPKLVAESVGRVLSDNNKRLSLEDEIESMRLRLVTNREYLSENLAGIIPNIHKTSGLFIRLKPEGFSKKQTEQLFSQGILALSNSRINLGGIKNSDIARFSNIMKDVLSK